MTFYSIDKEKGCTWPKLDEESVLLLTPQELKLVFDELDQDLVKIHNAKLVGAFLLKLKGYKNV